jgi:PleD family two-component response regulator
MPEDGEFARTPLALVVNDQEWTARSLESILSPSGFAVLKAYNARQALELVERATPDLLIIDLSLPDMDGTELCRKVKALPNVLRSTPLLMLTTGHLGRQERIEALRAGAWDVLRPPFDPEELILKVGAFVGAKQEADTAREESLLDQESGFYNVRGLLRRVGEITADAARHQRAVACVVIGPDWNGRGPAVDLSGRGEGLSEDAGGVIVRALASATRLSDTVGRLGESDFVILAPGTSSPGAARLAERVLDAVDSTVRLEAPDVGGLRLRAGYYAVPNLGGESIVPVDLLSRATLALRRAQADQSGIRIRSYDS